jgi:predicted HicB family RNase H-like nuclease
VRSEVIDVRAENAFLKETLTKIEYQCQLESIQIQKLRQKILMSKKYYLKELRADAKMLKRE